MLNSGNHSFKILKDIPINELTSLKVYVYFNLHKQTFSVKALEGEHRGRVVAHASMVKLSGCSFKVSQAGRLRVIREQKKYVHAGVVGRLCGFDHAFKVTESNLMSREGWNKAYYNPYKVETFVNGTQPLHEADKVCLLDKQIFFKIEDKKALQD